MLNFFSNPWVIAIGGAFIGGLLLYYCFGIGKSQKIIEQMGGRGGDAKIRGKDGVAIGGKGGGAGLGGKGGDGGNSDGVGDNVFAMGGEGGEAGQEDRGGKGGRGPLHVLMEDYPEKFKEVAAQFGITEEMAKKYGKGGDGAPPIK
jgi:hypothetical protein